MWMWRKDLTETRLDGRVVMVTGAGRGLGLAMAKGVAAAGGRVALLDVDEEVLDAAVAEMEAGAESGSALGIVADVADPASARAALDRAVAEFGGVHVLINNAVVGPERMGRDYINAPPRFWELDDGLWRKMLEVNVFGPQLMARTVAPHMLERGDGRILNITTSLDTMYRPGVGAYGPSKAALEAHTRVMAHDLEGTGVTANALLPGGPANTRMIPDMPGVGRESLIQPKIMVPPAVWLGSAEAAEVNGMRIIAARWDPALDMAARLEKAAAPVAWPQLGAQAVNPRDAW